MYFIFYVMNEEIGCVECRPLRRNWWVAAIGVMGATFFGLGPYITPNSDPSELAVRIMTGAIACFLLLASLFYVWHMASARIVANEEGLRWRDLKSEKFVRWDDVTDYYLGRSEPAEGTIETRQGNICISEFSNQEALRAYVQRKANKADACEWKRCYIPKSLKWPRTYKYIGAITLIHPGLLLLVLVALCIQRAKSPPTLTDLHTLIAPYREMWLTAGPIIGMAFILISLTFFSFFAFGICISLYHLYVNTWSRRRERIIVTPSGITYSDALRTISAEWNDLTCVTKQSRKLLLRNYVVETRNGNFTYSEGIDSGVSLLNVISQYAPTAVEDLEKSSTREAAGDTAGVRVEGDKRVHYYATGNTRALLWMIWFFALLPLVILGIYFPMDGTATHPEVHVAFFIGGVTIAAWLAYRYKNDYVAVDMRGVTHHSPLKTTFLHWEDVRKFGRTEWSFFFVEGTQSRIRFFSEIAHQEELLREIAKRSRNSETREWHTR